MTFKPYFVEKRQFIRKIPQNLSGKKTYLMANVTIDLFCLVCILVVFLGVHDAFAARKLIDCDFEEGENWRYSDYFDLFEAYLSDNWIITNQDCAIGNFCAESKLPGDSWTGDSTFYFSINTLNWGQEVFIRFKIKYPVDWEDQATDANRGSNHLRIGPSPGTWNHGCEYNPGWLHIYDTGVFYPRNDYYLKDNIWHEEAYYIKLPSGQGINDGQFIKWIDSRKYLESEAIFKVEFHLEQVWHCFLLPHYYKGPVTVEQGGLSDGNYKFWMDDIEVWDGLPSGADVNQDGSVNIQDVQIIVNVILGNATNNRSDVNDDGSTNISDVQAVVNEVID